MHSVLERIEVKSRGKCIALRHVYSSNSIVTLGVDRILTFSYHYVRSSRFINNISPYTPITNHQIPWVDPPLDLLQSVVVQSPKYFFPVRLVRIGLVYVRAAVGTNDFFELQANLNELLLVLLLLCIGSVVGPVDAVTHDGACGFPDGMH